MKARRTIVAAVVASLLMPAVAWTGQPPRGGAPMRSGTPTLEAKARAAQPAPLRTQPGARPHGRAKGGARRRPTYLPVRELTGNWLSPNGRYVVQVYGLRCQGGYVGVVRYDAMQHVAAGSLAGRAVFRNIRRVSAGIYIGCVTARMDTPTGRPLSAPGFLVVRGDRMELHWCVGGKRHVERGWRRLPAKYRLPGGAPAGRMAK